MVFLSHSNFGIYEGDLVDIYWTVVWTSEKEAVTFVGSSRAIMISSDQYSRPVSDVAATKPPQKKRLSLSEAKGTGTRK